MPIFDTHTYFGGSLIPSTGSPAVLRSVLESRGIGSAAVFSSHAASVDPVAGNRVLQKVLEQIPGSYGCLVTHANRVDASMTAMRELLSGKRFLGVAIVGMAPDQPIERAVADEIINAGRRYGKPVFLYTPNAATCHAALEIARAYPMLKFVLLGMGGQDWRSGIAAGRAATNVYLETSGPLDRAKLPAAYEAVGGHRILFGSGCPRVDPAAALGLIEDSSLSDDARRRILYDNARRLFGFDQEE